MKLTFLTLIKRLVLPGGVFFLLLILLLAAPGRLHAKPKPKPKPRVACSISGTSPVLVGNTYTYTLNGSCAVVNWSTTCGSVQSYTTTSATIYFNQTTCSSATIKALSSSGSTLASLTVTVNEPPALVTGTISNPSQTINYNTIPAQISCSAASGGACGGSYSYQWYSSTDNVNFTGVSGATGQNYQPGALTATTYYKRSVNCNTQAGYSTNTAQVTVYPQLVGGTLSLASQTINYNTSPSQLTLSGVSGGNLSYTYQWYSSPNNSTWTLISGQTGTSYTPPALTATTYYHVVVTSNGATASSVSALVTVYPQLVPGSVTPSQAINYNTVPTQLGITGLSGGNGSYFYQWYYSTNGGSTWTQLSGVTGAAYTPAALTATTEYEVIVTSNGIPATSGFATITVYPQLVTGTVSPTSQTINYNTVPPTSPSVSGTTGGSGTYTYQWQSCATSNGTYVPIGGATGSSYTPPAMTTGLYFEVVTTSYGASVTSAPVVVNVYPQLIAGAVTPSSFILPSGTSPGLLTCTQALGGGCSGAYQYQWQSSTDGVNFGNVIGATTLSYSAAALTATTYYQMAVSCNGQTVYSATAQFTIGSPNSNLNYIRTRTLSKPGVLDTVTADGLTSPYDVQQTTQYMDGLGRPIQTVQRQITAKGNDLVQPQVYDPFGRETIHYLPYAATTTDGNYKATAFSSLDSFNLTQYPGEQYYYGQTSFEASPLNRPVVNFPAGIDWVGSGRGVSIGYEVNTALDSVVIWNIAMAQGSLPVMSGYYPVGQLSKIVTADENGQQTVEYKDKNGLVILKKVQLSATPGIAYTGWLCTYYVYDYLNNLRFVLSPQAVLLSHNGVGWPVPQSIANALCFRYEYDYRNRMIIKKIPGAGETHIVYDERDRMVMSQDSMLRSTKQWLVTSYDTEDRPDSVGLMTDPTNYNNLAYHTAAAMTSPTYPTIANYPSYTLQALTHYDDYAWVTALGNSLTATMDTSYNSNSTYFITGYNSSPVYAVPLSPLMITRGMVTGTTQYVLGTMQAQWDVNFYDDRARVIEVQSTNYTNGLDKDITQYDFSGKPLRHLTISKKNGNNPQTHILDNQYTYDAGFRMTGVKDNIDGTLVTVDTMQYDELGQLQKKTLGGGLDSEVYAYNIRGWVTGINQNFLGGTVNDYFGMEIAYDKQTSVSNRNYMAAQYNGNITGLMWKSAGDGINRKYDFAYDDVNRLTAASFLQNPSGSTWNTAVMDYSVGNLTYDANGNILSLNQRGFKVGSPTSALIDQLGYAYQTNSNQLSYVIDGANDTASTLGDFHYKTKGAYDYLYDGNGSLKIDNNKGIDSIGYNYLSLPQYIHIKGKGTITYAYDTKGMKETKVVVDSTQSPVKTTTTEYIKSYQYTNDTLAQCSIEEGRERYQKKYLLSGDSIYANFCDYFLKDHLGDTRVILTTEKDTTQYIATMEALYRTKENALFYNIDSTSYPRNSVPGGYPTDNTTVPNDSVAIVSGSVGSHTQGPAIILKVMTGDSISVGVKSYYVGGGTAGNNSSSLPSVLNTLAGGLVALGGGGGHGTLATLDNTSGSPVYSALNSFLPSYDSTPSGKPKAYLNWMLLDNQFNYVSGNGQSGAIPVGAAGVLNALATTIKLKHSGYLYIWVSNETQNWNVFFDNLSVEDFSGPMLEETHYYPFGLTMAGISDKALKTPYAENKYKFNDGNELQNKEFGDGSGLEMYDATFRMLDPQLGRFWQIDPLGELAEGWSPYAFALNNPILLNDPLGDTATLPKVTVTPLHVHTPNDQLPSLALIGTPPAGIEVPPAPTTGPDIPITNPGTETGPGGEPGSPILPGFSPLAGALTIVGVLIPAGGPSFPNGDEMFAHNHPELTNPALRPFTKDKPFEDIYLVRYGDGPESKEDLGSQANKAQRFGFPHGVSTVIRAKAPSYGKSAKLLEVMRHFEVRKTGDKPDHFTVVLPNPVTQQVADEFNLLFIKR